jgi:Holliday junction resolvasome RuvABC DNA-binding subunit
MIASITGKIQSKHTDSLILDVQGLVLEVTVTNRAR